MYEYEDGDGGFDGTGYWPHLELTPLVLGTQPEICKTITKAYSVNGVTAVGYWWE